MFVVIPDVLTEAEVATLRTNAASEDFLDGRLTAAGRARNVKNNLQTDRGSERMSEAQERSEEHTSELQSLMRISYAVFCLNKTKITKQHRENGILLAIEKKKNSIKKKE